MSQPLPTEWHREAFGDPYAEVVLGYSKSRNPILYWKNYGIVCPNELTTNGNVILLLRSHSRPVELTPPGAAWFVGWAFYNVRYRPKLRRG